MKKKPRSCSTTRIRISERAVRTKEWSYGLKRPRRRFSRFCCLTGRRGARGAAAGALGLAAALAGCGAPDTEAYVAPRPYSYSGKGVAVIESVEGYVMAQTSRWRAWEKVIAANAPAPKGAKLRTVNGRVTLRFPGVGRLRVEERSLVDLDRERSVNVFKKRRTTYPVFLEYGRAEAKAEKDARGVIWICTDIAAVKLVEGSMAVSMDGTTTAACESGEAEVYLSNCAWLTLSPGARIRVRMLSRSEARVQAEAGRAVVRLRRNRRLTLSADGFDAAGLACPCEADIARR